MSIKSTLGANTEPGSFGSTVSDDLESGLAQSATNEGPAHVESATAESAPTGGGASVKPHATVAERAASMFSGGGGGAAAVINPWQSSFPRGFNDEYAARALTGHALKT